MLSEFLKMSWNDVMNSDYLFKSNNVKHVIQIRGSELNGPSDVVLLVYYNMYTDFPMVAVSVRDGHYEDPIEEIPGFNIARNYIKDDEGKEETQVVYIAEEINELLD